MSVLVTADLHLDASPDASYRWQVFNKIRDLHKELDFDTLLIAGDLVDKKDHHGSQFVNTVVDELVGLHEELGIKIIIMAGNHDYIDNSVPFFRFLRYIPGIEYAHRPVYLRNHKLILIPHSRTIEEDLKSHKVQDALNKDAYAVITHVTMNQSLVANGRRLPGLPIELFESLPVKLVISGDIHIPQRIGKKFHYVGSPHHVNFGDEFPPRMILLEPSRRAWFNIELTDAVQKHKFDVVNAEMARELLQSKFIKTGDQVLVRCCVPKRVKDSKESALSISANIQQIPKELGLKLSRYVVQLVTSQVVENAKQYVKNTEKKEQAINKTTAEVVKDFAKKEALEDEVIHAGIKLSDSANKN